MWTGMSLGCCFLGVFLRLGAGWMEEGPSDMVDGSRLMMDSGCEGHGADGDTLDWGVFTMYWPCRFFKEMGEKKKELSELGTFEWLNVMREITAAEHSMWLRNHHFVYMKVTSVFCHNAQLDERDFETMMSEILWSESW